MQVQTQPELRVAVEIRSHSSYEQAQCGWVCIGHEEVVPRLRPFSPVQDNTGDEERLLGKVSRTGGGVSPDACDGGPPELLRVLRNSSLGWHPGTDRLDLCRRQVDVLAPIGQSPFRDRNDLANLPLGQPQPPQRLAQFRSFPAVQFVPLLRLIEQFFRHVRSHPLKVSTGYDTPHR